MNYVRLFRVPPEMKLQDAEDVINKAMWALDESPLASTLTITPNMTIFCSLITAENPKDSKGKTITKALKEKRD